MFRILTAVCRACMSYRYPVLMVLVHLADIFKSYGCIALKEIVICE